MLRQTEKDKGPSFRLSLCQTDKLTELASPCFLLPFLSSSFLPPLPFFLSFSIISLSKGPTPTFSSTHATDRHSSGVSVFRCCRCSPLARARTSWKPRPRLWHHHPQRDCLPCQPDPTPNRPPFPFHPSPVKFTFAFTFPFTFSCSGL